MTADLQDEDSEAFEGVTLYFKVTGGDEMDTVYDIGDALEESVTSGTWLGSGFMFDTGERDIAYEGTVKDLLEEIKTVLANFKEAIPEGSFLVTYNGSYADRTTIQLKEFLT